MHADSRAAEINNPATHRVLVTSEDNNLTGLLMVGVNKPRTLCSQPTRSISLQVGGFAGCEFDDPSMIALGAEAVVFGPGDIRVAHRTGEFVPVDQLIECAHILEQAIERFCK